MPIRRESDHYIDMNTGELINQNKTVAYHGIEPELNKKK